MKRLEMLKELWGDMLIIALGLILTIHFILFKLYGWILIGEDNPWILNVELVLSVLIIAFGIERTWRDFRGYKRGFEKGLLAGMKLNDMRKGGRRGGR